MRVIYIDGDNNMETIVEPAERKKIEENLQIISLENCGKGTNEYFVITCTKKRVRIRC